MRFILIHGGFHGAWCWTRVIPELRALGHDAIALDLPGHGLRRDEPSTISNRRQAILDVLRLDDVLVGHSGGGFDITLAADAAPEKVAHLVYLAAALPLEGRPLLDATQGRPAADNECGTQLMTDDTGITRFVRPNASGRMECTDFEAVKDFFYHDCDEASARWAFAQLTPAPIEFLMEPIHLQHFWKAELPRSYIRCLQDRSAPANLMRGFIDRLGVNALELNSSHSPFLSMPRATAELLIQATKTRPVSPLHPN